MNTQHTAGQKQSLIESLLSIPGMLRASDLELKPQPQSVRQELETTAKSVSYTRSPRGPAANDGIYSDTPETRLERIRRLMRTPIARTVLDEVLANAEIRQQISKETDSPHRSWGVIIHDAAQQSVAAIQLTPLEADLVRLAVILLMTQSIVDDNEQGEDADWVYRAIRPARAQIEKLNPEAGRWLQYALNHGEEEGEPNERSAQLKALAWQACLGATARAGTRK